MTIALRSIQGLFPTPLLTFQLGEAEAINRALLAEIAVRQSAEPGAARSNRLGWHSVPDLFERKEKAHAALAATIREACAEAMLKVAPESDLSRFEAAFEGWINVNPTGAYNRPHDHPGSLLSGVYYVSTPAAAGDDGVSGRIEFLAPRSGLNDGLLTAPFAAPSASIQPRPGMLLVFPANVLHWVHPNLAEEVRVTVAFNLKYRPRKAPAGARRRK